MDQLVEYAVGGVVPLWELGSMMMRSVGEAGVAGTVRMSKQSIQYHYDDAHKDQPDEEKRFVHSFAAAVCVNAIVIAAIAQRSRYR